MSELGIRMKNNYEARTRYFLPRRTYTIIRLDGKAFHTYMEDAEVPYDTMFMQDFDRAVESVLSDVQGAQFAYSQSDECSILVTDFENERTEAWFDGNVQKIASVAASAMTVYFNAERQNRAESVHKDLLEKEGHCDEMPSWVAQFALFDARVFTIPDPVEVENYFIWRQKDWERNSLQMLARSLYSHKELLGKSNSDLHEMIYAKDLNWANFPAQCKNGRVTIRSSNSTIGIATYAAPQFTKERDWLRDRIPKHGYSDAQCSQ